MCSGERGRRGLAQILVTGHVGVVVQDADRDRVVPRRHVARRRQVARIVLKLVAIDFCQAGTDGKPALMVQQLHPKRVLDVRLEHLRQPFRAALQDAHEREAAMPVGGAQDVVERFGNPIDRLRHERDVLHPERHLQRLQRLQITAVRGGVAARADRRGRRGLLLGQAVDLVVMQHDREVHVVANGVNPVRRADAAAIAVAGIDEHRQIGPGHADALGDRQGAAVQAVQPVGAHVVRQAAGAADAGDEHGLFRAQVFVAAQPLHRGQDGVVATARAPARHPALVILQRVVLIVQAQQAFGGVAHGCSPVAAASFSRTTRRMEPGLIGWPLTSLQQSISISVRARSSMASAE